MRQRAGVGLLPLLSGEQALFAVGLVGSEVLEIVVVGEVFGVAEQGVQPFDQSLFADRAQARRRRRHQLRVLQRVVDLLDVWSRHRRRRHRQLEARIDDDLVGHICRHAREVIGEKLRHWQLARIFHHPLQRAELDAVWMRFDLDWLFGHLVDDARAVLDLCRSGLRPGRCLVELEHHARMGVREAGLLEVGLDAVAACFVLAQQQHLDARTRGLRVPVVVGLKGLAVDARRVLRSVDEQPQLLGLAALQFADDRGGLPRRHLAVHDRRRDADALLATRLLESVELRPVQQLGEDLPDLGLWNSGTVVLDTHDET